MTAPDLKPCPHCGGPAVLITPALGGRPYVCCSDNYCTGPQATAEKAAAAWNRRCVEAAKQVCDNVAEHAAKLERGQP
jgi:ssDNA-binding Zn-finger/Zn-ribbon topoisomerase 1